MNTERARVGWGFWLWWVLASTVGLAVGLGAVGLAVGGAVGGAVALGLALAVAVVFAAPSVGIALGIAQWLVLRRQVSRAGWWVLASTVGLVVGPAAGFGLVLTSGRSMEMSFILALAVGGTVGLVGGAVGGAVYGAITGSVMVWLLRQPAAKELDPS